MKLQHMFQKDINRNINGVIKVAQDDEQSLRQELSEYIITKELRRHFRTFFDNYAHAIDTPTDKIGVWISGFFGSGKSHFLKMLSYLLTNKTVCGKKTMDYFADKFKEDPMMLAMVQKCVSVPTESILFNIDVEAFADKDKTAVLRVFAKTFYRHCGYYGDDLKIVKLERYLEKQGKTEEFRRTYEKVCGVRWENDRDSFAFREDDFVSILQSVLGMSEQAARNWFNGTETAELSIAQLVDDIKKYVDSKGKNFRLLFMIDEVGQYIGDDGDLMLNLQSIVEEIGTRCQGKVWVMVTSQEAIDSVIHITGSDFSKIQGRFDTRLSLTSSSVAEVIQKRILAKKPEADQLLRMVYDKEHAVLKNLFTFNNTVLDIKGYVDGAEFSANFPFVPYQFIIIQKVLAEIRKHGNSGKHLSEGERSMLSGFKEAAQSMQNKDENALVPFYLFYDTLHASLESTIRRVIDRCQTAADKGDGLEQQDVSVLKLLYLVRYIDDIEANVDNIAVLMTDDIRTDKIALRASVAASLERLLSQNYISRSGDTYAFLTDEEQDIAAEINVIPVDSANINEIIANIVYGDIYPAKKFKYGNKYDFSFERLIDETRSGSAFDGMRLRIVTVAGDYYKAPEQRLIMDSSVNNEAILVLPEDNSYYEDLEQVMKVDKYAKQHNVAKLPESVQDIILKHQSRAKVLREQAKDNIMKAILGAKVFVRGETIDIRGDSAKNKLDIVMNQLIESVYDKLAYVNHCVESDADILAILNGTDNVLAGAGSGINNEDALNEISQWLELRHSSRLKTTMGEVQRRYSAIPYGWREIDIAALIARLVAQQKVTVEYGGADLSKDDRNFVDYLRRKTLVDKTIVKRRIAPSEDLIRKSIAFLRDYLKFMNIPSDEDGLIHFVTKKLEEKRDYCQNLLDSEYRREQYPDRDVVAAARDLMKDILSQRRDNVALLKRLIEKQNELFDSAEDMEDVEQFFRSQRETFDNAKRKMARLNRERDYFSADLQVQEMLTTIADILAMPKPYGRIAELPDLIVQVEIKHDALLDNKRAAVAKTVAQAQQDVRQMARDVRGADSLLSEADKWFVNKGEAVKAATSLIDLDAMISQTQSYKDNISRRLERLVPPVDTDEPKPKKIAALRRNDLCVPKRLQTPEDVDAYVEAIRQKLMQTLADCDGIQIN